MVTNSTIRARLRRIPPGTSADVCGRPVHRHRDGTSYSLFGSARPVTLSEAASALTPSRAIVLSPGALRRGRLLADMSPRLP
jgi:hypothetical protein